MFYWIGKTSIAVKLGFLHHALPLVECTRAAVSVPTPETWASADRLDPTAALKRLQSRATDQKIAEKTQ